MPDTHISILGFSRRARLQSRALPKNKTALAFPRQETGIHVQPTPGEDRQTRRTAPGRTRIPRASDPRQDRDRRDQAAAQPARPVAGLLARRRGPLRRDRQGSVQRLPLHGAWQPGGGDHQRHRGAGTRRHRPAGRQAGDGGQGRPVQEVRRHRRVRHRDRREGQPGQAGRRHRRARADLRRDQPGRHQGAGLLLRGAKAARAHEDPGLP
jgi:hypothetical protein